jgi:hypothetical protein
MNVIDLFSGIGGFSLGLERAGMRTVAFCEINQFCTKVLKERWPTVPTYPGIYALNSLLRRVRKRSSRPDFLAKTYHSLERVPDLPASVQDSSGLSYEPFAWFDHGSRCWRTWQRCLVEGWTRYSDVWPRSGMTRNGIAYRRQPLVLLTSATASGSLLPTPEASNTKAIALRSAGRLPRNFLAPLPTPTASSYGSNRSASSGAARRPSLAQIAKMEIWPTPTASLGTKGGRVTPRKGQEGGTLIEAVSARMWATPTVNGNHNRKGLSKSSGDGLATQAGGSLNPTWVEWLMGFPLEWTALKDWGTRSSRKSRKSSAAQS